jgi:hypothetical protein
MRDEQVHVNKLRLVTFLYPNIMHACLCIISVRCVTKSKENSVDINVAIELLNCKKAKNGKL